MTAKVSRLTADCCLYRRHTVGKTLTGEGNTGVFRKQPFAPVKTIQADGGGKKQREQEEQRA